MHAVTVLKVGDVAALFGVAPHTVNYWCRVGRMSCWRTPGGQLRFFESDVLALIDSKITEWKEEPMPETGLVQLAWAVVKAAEAMRIRWVDADPEVRKRELWQPLHAAADALRERLEAGA